MKDYNFSSIFEEFPGEFLECICSKWWYKILHWNIADFPTQEDALSTDKRKCFLSVF